MPFTGSHPAIILPLLRYRIFSVSGLLMGSMVPDFEFFLRLEANVVYGHSIGPMFWLNIPTALLCITIYHCIVRDHLILNLPDYFKKRFWPFLSFDWLTYLKTNYVKVVLSILVGNLSHLFWDAFTHSNGLVVAQIPSLSKIVWQVPVYDILQYAFSILGAICILLFISKLPIYDLKVESKLKDNVIYWLIVFAITASVYLIRYDSEDYEQFTSRIVFICSGFLAGLILASFWNKIKKPKGEKAQVMH